MSSDQEPEEDEWTKKFNDLRWKKIEERKNMRRAPAEKQSSGLLDLLNSEPEKVRDIYLDP